MATRFGADPIVRGSGTQTLLLCLLSQTLGTSLLAHSCHITLMQETSPVRAAAQHCLSTLLGVCMCKCCVVLSVRNDHLLLHGWRVDPNLELFSLTARGSKRHMYHTYITVRHEHNLYLGRCLCDQHNS